MHKFIDKTPIDHSGESAITALVDGDSIAYILGWNCKVEDEVETVVSMIDQFMSQMLVQVQARQFAGFLSPKKTFRNHFYPEYKAKRKLPAEIIQQWKQYIDEYLVQNWGFGYWPNYEADDAVSMLQNNMVNTIICSPDKDMKQVPGNHFDYKKGVRCFISPEEAAYNWGYQMLLGDQGDNIPGAAGIGKIGATKIMDSVQRDWETNSFGDPAQYILDMYVHYGKYTSIDDARVSYINNVRLITLAYDPESGDMEFLSAMIHSFDLDAAGTSSYLSQSESTKAADDLFGNW